MSRTREATARLSTNLRLLAATILMGVVIKLVPAGDKNTLIAIRSLLMAMDADENLRKFISRNANASPAK